MALNVERKIKYVREELTSEYVKAGEVTPKVLSLSEALDRLIVDYLNHQKVNKQGWNLLNNTEMQFDI